MLVFVAGETPFFVTDLIFECLVCESRLGELFILLLSVGDILIRYCVVATETIAGIGSMVTLLHKIYQVQTTLLPRTDGHSVCLKLIVPTYYYSTTTSY